MEVQKRYYTISDIQNIIGCARTTAYRMVLNEVPHVYIGRKIFVSIEAFEKWMDEHTSVTQEGDSNDES